MVLQSIFPHQVIYHFAISWKVKVVSSKHWATTLDTAQSAEIRGRGDNIMDYRPTDYSRYHIEVVQYIPTLTLS